MTLDEAKKIAEKVLSGELRVYVRAAHELAEFVVSLTPDVIVQSEPFRASPSVIPISIDEDELDES